MCNKRPFLFAGVWTLAALCAAAGPPTGGFKTDTPDGRVDAMEVLSVTVACPLRQLAM